MKFEIWQKLPTMNDYTRANRSHWSRGAKMKRQVQEDIGWAIRLAMSRNELEPVKEPAMFAFEWHEKTFRRDKDNVASAKKFIFDALQETGILQNDGNDYVLGFSDTFVRDNRDGVIVTITTPTESV